MELVKNASDQRLLLEDGRLFLGDLSTRSDVKENQAVPAVSSPNNVLVTTADVRQPGYA